MSKQPAIILHHYNASPYAEKSRAMLGYAGIAWQSMISPSVPPRPALDPLAGGYRRIPVMQIGADIFCDTKLIAEEVAAISGDASLRPKSVDPSLAAFVEFAETDVFFSVVNSVPPKKVLTTLLKTAGPIGMFKFIKDRAGIAKTSNTRMPSKKRAADILSSFFEQLEQQLSNTPYLTGDQPSYTDFAAYCPLWFLNSLNQNPLAQSSHAQQWFEHMLKFSVPATQQLTRQQAFEAAKAEPRALPDSIDDAKLGQVVDVAPSDYARDAVTGELVACTANRWILKRTTEHFGDIHIHCPQQGFALELTT